MTLTSAENRHNTFTDVLLMAGILFTFLYRIMEMLWLPSLDAAAQYLPTLWGLLAGALAVRGQAFRRKTTWVLAAGLVLIFLRCFFGGRDTFYWGYRSIVYGVLAFGVCYQAAFGLSKKWLLTFLRLLLAFWTLFMAGLSLVGIWAALYDQTIMTSAGGVYRIGVTYSRLYLLTFCTNSGSNLALSLLAALIGMLLTRNRLGRVLYVLASMVQYAALGLTVARTAFISVSIALGLLLACGLMAKLRGNRLSEKLVRLISFILAATLAVGSFLLLSKSPDLFGDVKELVRSNTAASTDVVESTDAAEDTDTEEAAATLAPRSTNTQSTVQPRPITMDENMLTQRQFAWQAVYRYIRQHPETLLYGTSVVMPMAEVNPLADIENAAWDHAHNMYIQILLECGIPGIILLVLFLYSLARAALRLFFSKDKPLWQRALPVIPICILISELAECMTMLVYNLPALAFLMLFSGLVIKFAEE